MTDGVPRGRSHTALERLKKKPAMQIVCLLNDTESIENINPLWRAIFADDYKEMGMSNWQRKMSMTPLGAAAPCRNMGATVVEAAGRVIRMHATAPHKMPH